MAVLSNADRASVSQALLADICQAREGLGALTKADFRAAVDAADDWANTNSAAYNTAIPQPARGALTSAQKARLLEYVVRQRWIAGA
jgi:hypothetical protein